MERYLLGEYEIVVNWKLDVMRYVEAPPVDSYSVVELWYCARSVTWAV